MFSLRTEVPGPSGLHDLLLSPFLTPLAVTYIEPLASVDFLLSTFPVDHEVMTTSDKLSHRHCFPPQSKYPERRHAKTIYIQILCRIHISFNASIEVSANKVCVRVH